MQKTWDKLRTTLEMIKFSHSVFALPFALTAAAYATGGFPGWQPTLLIIAAMISARSAAMAFNRLVDHNFDARNPRTQDRPLPSGRLSRGFVIGFCLLMSVVFLAASASFNQLTLLLAPLVLVFLFGYSLAKRFTHYTQIWLGLALGMAPPAAWIALTGTLSAFPLFVGLGVVFWVAGFDLIYASQDHTFDQASGLKSLVVKLGIRQALLVARIFHILAILAFATAGISFGSHFFYFIGLACMAGLLIYEHTLISPDDLTRVDQAFFTANGFVAILYFIFAVTDLIL